MKGRIIRKSMVQFFAACLLLALIPAKVQAASNAYVPIEGTAMEKSGSNKETFSIKYTYDSSGRIKKSVETWSGHNNWTSTKTYTWNKFFVTSIKYNETGSSRQSDTFKYNKNNLATKWTAVRSNGTTYNTSYKWNKKGRTATVTQIIKNNGNQIKVTGTCKVDSKKRVISETFIYNKKKSEKTNIYYDDGIIKQIKQSGDFSVIDHSEKIKYNSNGYTTSVQLEFPDGTVRKITYKYTMDKKKGCPKKIIRTDTYNNVKTTTTYTFTKFKKVSKVRNCDATGITVPLGANY